MPIQAIKEITDIIGSGDTLSTSLRLTKYAKLGDKHDKKAAVEFVVKGCQESLRSKLEHPDGQTLYMKLGGRLIINQAGGVLENAGLCLHRNFGYPYIPGSAVKGVARHYAWEQWSEMTDGDEKAQFAQKIAFTFGFPTGDRIPKDTKKIKDRCLSEEYLDDYLELNFPELFKNDKAKYKSSSGSIAFLDATPEGKVSLVSDILTCHHPKYYGGEMAEALDNEDPIPLPFPVVEAGVTFIFQLVPLKANSNIEFATTMLKNALELNGIGAKTSAGYGWFEFDIEREERIKRQAAAKATELANKKAVAEAEVAKKAEHTKKLKALKDQQDAELAAKQATIKAKQDAALGSNLSKKLSEAKKFSDIINHMDTAAKAGKIYSDSELDELKAFIKNSFDSANKKDRKKFKKLKTDSWNRIGNWIGDELKSAWFKELIK